MRSSKIVHVFAAASLALGAVGCGAAPEGNAPSDFGGSNAQITDTVTQLEARPALPEATNEAGVHAPNGATRSVTFVNNSMRVGDVCITPLDLEAPGGHRLAWLARYSAPGRSVSFQWSQDLGFAWAETGKFVPGVTFEASQVIAAEARSANAITFGVDPYGMGSFLAPTGDSSGAFTIRTQPGVPSDRFAVALALSGSPAFAVPAVGNASVSFKAPTTFGIRFGSCMQGDVMDETDAFVTIPFGDSRTAVTAVLNADDTFSFR